LSLLVGLTKCAAHLGNRAAHLINWANAQRDWPNARAIYQTLRNWSIAERLTNLSNVLRDCPDAQIGQMRLTFGNCSILWSYFIQHSVIDTTVAIYKMYSVTAVFVLQC